MEKIRLSASKMKTVKDCSWKYYSRYVLNLPEIKTEALLRGGCVHSILEHLLKPKHQHYCEIIVKNTGRFPLEIERFINKKTREYNLKAEDDIETINEMVYTALQFDFLCSGCQTLEAEKRFELETENYIIKGYIDKLAVYKNGRVIVWDYKSSKGKFSKEELAYNMQCFIYSLASLKILNRIPEIKFFFLRFSKQPIQEAPKLTEKQLKGFEIFLDHVAEYLKDFDRKKALRTMAYFDKNKRWLCGKEDVKEDGTPSYICEHRKPFYYFVLYDKENKIISTDFEMLPLEKKRKDGERIGKIFYRGCPAWNQRLLPRHFSLIENLHNT